MLYFQPYLIDQITYPFGDFLLRVASRQPHRFGHNIKNGHPRIQGRIRVLEYHLDIPAHSPQLFFIQGRELYFLIVKMKFNASFRRFNDSQNRPAQSRFSAARFPNHSQHLIFLYLKRHIIHRFYKANLFFGNSGFNRIIFLQPSYLQQCFRHLFLHSAVRDSLYSP